MTSPERKWMTSAVPILENTTIGVLLIGWVRGWGHTLESFVQVQASLVERV